jgi:hypothetical protein
MSDTRESILQRTFVVLSAIPAQIGYTAHSVFRNRALLKEDKRPAIVLLDGTEQSDTRLESRGRMFMAPHVMVMSPQIFVVLKERLTPSNDGVGEELNTFRVAIVNALAHDAMLIRLCGANGEVALRRCITDMQNGALLQGQMQLDFALTYVLDPNKLSTSVVT